MKDKCVVCGCKTQYKKTDHIDFRKFYVEGAGQLCGKCWSEIYETKKLKFSERGIA
jgi:hypothetical protein